MFRDTTRGKDARILGCAAILCAAAAEATADGDDAHATGVAPATTGSFGAQLDPGALITYVASACLALLVLCVVGLVVRAIRRHFDATEVEAVAVDPDGMPQVPIPPMLVDAFLLPRSQAWVALPNALPRLGVRASGVRVPQRVLQQLQRLNFSEGGAGQGATPEGALPVMCMAAVSEPLFIKLLTHAALPVPVLGSVQMRFTVRQRRWLWQREAFDISVGLHAMRPHKRGTELDIVRSVVPSGGDAASAVWTCVSTILCFHKRRDPPPRAPAVSAPSLADADATQALQLAGNAGRRWASLSKDWNPVHVSAVTAWFFGFRRGAIAHAHCVLHSIQGALEDVAVEARAAATTRSRREGARGQDGEFDGRCTLAAVFQRPLFIPGRATAGIRVDDAGRGREPAIAATDGDGRAAASVSFTVVADRDAAQKPVMTGTLHVY